jgi:hypothetical protein
MKKVLLLGKILLRKCTEGSIGFKISPIWHAWYGKGDGKVASVHAMTAYRGSICMATLIPNLCTRWRLVADFTPPTASGEGGEDWVGLPTAGLDFRKQKNTLPLLRIEPRIVWHVA